MGLFDSKQTKEEKRIFKELLSLRNSSQALRVWLPKDEKEFLSSTNKERLINAYQYSLELINDNDFVQTYNVSNLGKCFDEVLNLYNVYQMKVSKTGLSFMEYVSEQVIVKKKQIVNEEHVKNIYEAERVVLEAKDMIQEANKSYVDFTKNIDDMNDYVEQKLEQYNSRDRYSESKEFLNKAGSSVLNDMRGLTFKERFPHYQEFQALVVRAKLGVLSPSQKELVDKIVVLGKSYDPNFVLDDILIPYLEEKANMKILDESEKKLFCQKAGHDRAYAEKLICSILMNVYLLEGRVNKNDVIDSFEWCSQKIDLFLPKDVKDSMLQSDSRTSGVTR